jgi:hypothetical protein
MPDLMLDRSAGDGKTLPRARGPFSEGILHLLAGGGIPTELPPAPEDPSGDDDLHLALYLAYEMHYRGLPGVDDDLEWDPRIIALRHELESAFEVGVRRAVGHREVEAGQVDGTLARKISS